MESLYEVLVARDGKEEAIEQIKEMLERIDEEGIENTEEILYDYQCEPDFIMDILHYYKYGLKVKK